jgi:hypothetical protein
MLCVVFAGPALSAQTFDATNLQEPKLLAATWLVYGGDDPAFARPDFDDSQWMIFDSTKDLRALFPKSHPEVVWYRLRVKVLPRQTDFALEENSLSSAFEVFYERGNADEAGSGKPLRSLHIFSKPGREHPGLANG